VLKQDHKKCRIQLPVLVVVTFGKLKVNKKKLMLMMQ